MAMVGSIAEQTDLPALNAAIEAARAGGTVVASRWWDRGDGAGGHASNPMKKISTFVAVNDESIGRVVGAIDDSGDLISSSLDVGQALAGRFERLRTSAEQVEVVASGIHGAISELVTTTDEVERSAELVAPMAQDAATLAGSD